MKCNKFSIIIYFAINYGLSCRGIGFKVNSSNKKHILSTTFIYSFITLLFLQNNYQKHITSYIITTTLVLKPEIY